MGSLSLITRRSVPQSRVAGLASLRSHPQLLPRAGTPCPLGGGAVLYGCFVRSGGAAARPQSPKNPGVSSPSPRRTPRRPRLGEGARGRGSPTSRRKADPDWHGYRQPSSVPCAEPESEHVRMRRGLTGDSSPASEAPSSPPLRQRLGDEATFVQYEHAIEVNADPAQADIKVRLGSVLPAEPAVRRGGVKPICRPRIGRHPSRVKTVSSSCASRISCPPHLPCQRAFSPHTSSDLRCSHSGTSSPTQ